MAKRILAIVLSIVLCFNMLQLQAFAVDTNQMMDGYYILDEQGNIVGKTDTAENVANGFTVSKTIQQTGENQFDITLKVVTSQEVVTSDAAIQLVIDTSSSMQYCSEDCGNRSCSRHPSRLNAVKGILTGNGGFLDSLTAGNSGKIYVSVVTFGSGAKTVCEWVDIKTAEGLAAVKNAINGLSAPDNATNMHAGMMLARNRWGMSQVETVAAKFTVVLSDGYANCVGAESSSTSSISLSGRSPSSANPTDAGTNGAKSMAATVRGLSEVYVVGYGVEAEYLQGIFGSNVYAGTGAASVTAAFANIAQSAVNGMNGAGSTVTDPMGEFVIMGDVSGLSSTGVEADGDTLTWKLDPANAQTSVSGNVTTYTYEITYSITLDTNSESFLEDEYYPTNGYTYLSVPSDNGTIEIPFNVPAVSGKWPYFSVSYQYEGEVPADAPSAPGSASYKKNSSVAVAKAPTAANYTFSGWTTVDADVDDGTFQMPGKNVVLVGSWVEHDKFNYTLTYNGNGGTLSGGEVVYGDVENIASTYATSATMGVDANSFVRTNYTFTGWNTAADGTGTAYAADSTVALTAADNTKTLYAQWKENPKYDYTVTYNANFGANEVEADEENASQVYDTSKTFTVNANNFVRDNYTFIGWATEVEGEVVYQPGATISFTKGGSEELYAVWQEHPKYDYTVTYNANFGLIPATAADDENISGTYATTYSINVNDNPFERANHTFIGWSETKNGEVIYNEGDSLSFENGGEKTLYAQWIEHDKYAYTVIYNGNGGALADSALSYGDEENVESTYATAHTVYVDENTFIREHYTFLGWNTEADGTGISYTAEEAIYLTAENNTKTLYAQWQEHPKYDYTVTYNSNFGEIKTKADAENATQVYDTTKSIGVDVNTFVRENYTFLGWATEPNGIPNVLVGSKLELTPENNEVILYAQWVENPKYDYSVIYNANFGDAETKADEDNVEQVYNVAYTIGVDANSFVRSYYTFAGWNTAADGTGTAYEVGQVVELTSENNTVTLYAQWVEYPKYDYSVTYNANFGEEPATKADAENVAGIYATEYNIGVDANGFDRANYTFIGWNTAADGTGTAYEVGQNLALTAQENEAILYAQWEENPKYDYSVTYNANFGETPATKADTENTEQTYATEYTIGVDGNDFVRENYTFIGWNTAADGTGTAYAAGQVVELTAEINEATLYAQWEENPKYDYSVTYNANFGETPATKADTENTEQTYATEYTIGVDGNDFVRENYTFIGWATEPQGEVVYQSGDIISFTEGGSEELYAQWIEHDKFAYTVIYNGNGGALEDSALSYGDSENIVETYATTAEITVDANTFVRANYTFVGWNTAADGTGTAYTAEQVIALTSENNTVTLYAQWEENPKYDYSVTYEANFEGAPEAKADAENASGVYETAYNIAVDENSFERTGYTFIGWNTAADGTGTAYTAEQVIALTSENNTVTLYAQWEIIEIEYTVEYVVRVDAGAYAPFQGELPEDAPKGGKIPYGTTAIEGLAVPQQIADNNYTYDFTAVEQVVNADGSIKVTVYYTYTSPAPPAQEEPTTPPAPPVNPVGENGLVDIPDEQIPLADAPKTGDAMLLYAGITALSGLGLLQLNRKKEEEEEEA